MLRNVDVRSISFCMICVQMSSKIKLPSCFVGLIHGGEGNLRYVTSCKLKKKLKMETTPRTCAEQTVLHFNLAPSSYPPLTKIRECVISFLKVVYYMILLYRCRKRKWTAIYEIVGSI